MEQTKTDAWVSVKMFCPHCGTMNVGYKDQNGRCRFQCSRCTAVMVCVRKNRRHDQIEITVPKESERMNV